MKWFLVALMVSGASPNGAGQSPHAEGHAMHAWELGEGDPARLMCLLQIETFVQHRAGKPGVVDGLEPRVKGLVEVEVVKTLLCVDEGTVKALANSQLGGDSLSIRPQGELKMPLRKLPAPPAPNASPTTPPGITPDDGAPGILLKIPFPPKQ